MTKQEALAKLRSRERDLRGLGIEHLSLFGSTARGEEQRGSDIDLVATIDYDKVRALGPFGYFSLEDRLAAMLGVNVDFITEPGGDSPRLQAEIDRDRVRVF